MLAVRSSDAVTPKHLGLGYVLTQANKEKNVFMLSHNHEMINSKVQVDKKSDSLKICYFI